ncbi:MAG: M28 family peptidase [Candidatus Heimdallarchaeota archaeon]|nr:MAG: M28 family peptidase [Candidatus Heimdallarchaeota archaeon]
MSNALKHVKYLAEEIGPRGSTSNEEKLAAEYVENNLRSLDNVDVFIQTFRGLSTWTWTVVMSMLFVLIAIVIYPIFPLLAALLVVCGLFFYIMEVDNRPILSRLMPKRESRNVISRIKTESISSEKVVLVAHVDTSRADYSHHPKRVTSFRKLAVMNLMLVVLVSIIYSLGALFDFVKIEIFPNNVEWLFTLLLAIPILFSCILIILREFFYDISPGANDNASGVGVVLELMDYYSKNSLKNTEILAVFTGCEEAWCYGMIEFLNQYGKDLQEAYFINIDNVGAGTPAFLQIEGMFFSHKADPILLKLARKLQKNHSELQVEERSFRAGYQDGTVAMVKGYKAITFLALDQNNFPPNWHWETDVVENIEENVVRTTEEFVKLLITAIDQRSNTTTI